MATDAHPEPSEAEVRSYFETCSNWGRWGPDDSAGTVNLITPEKRREAAALVRSGRSVSCAYPLNTQGAPGNWRPAQHFMTIGPGVSADYIGLVFHGYATTHVDALCHIFWEGRMWNGKNAAEEVTSAGARTGAVAAWKDGIITRGVLLDIPRLRGTDYVTTDRPTRGWELEAAAEAEGVELRPGDAVLVRGARPAFLAGNPDAVPGMEPTPGLHVDCVPVLKQADAAILGWDMLDARPHSYPDFADAPGGPVHVLTNRTSWGCRCSTTPSSTRWRRRARRRGAGSSCSRSRPCTCAEARAPP